MRLKDDEYRLLHALSLGNAGERLRLSPSRRLALMRRFSKRGWIRNGRITAAGERLLSRQSRAEVPAGPAAVAEAVVDLELPDEEIEERHSADDNDVHRPEEEGMVDST